MLLQKHSKKRLLQGIPIPPNSASRGGGGGGGGIGVVIVSLL